MSRPLEDWADLKYAPGTHTAHVFPFGSLYPLCSTVDGSMWFGTGCWDEIEHAKSLPVCIQCKPGNPHDVLFTEFDAPAPLYAHTDIQD